MNLQSPQGLMLHGEVGTGKSMLIDLFADCLPHRKKRRWHFNTFMLDALARLEALRKSRSAAGSRSSQDDYSLLWLARDLVQTSPILFLDEFQLPDRAASKILSNLLTSFFQLGGVLIATSNRMPEELAKAAGIEFARPVSRLSRLGWSIGLHGVVGRDDGPGQKGEFAQFLEVLRARCEVWEMEGKSDYRRMSNEAASREATSSVPTSSAASTVTTPELSSHASSAPDLNSPSSAVTESTTLPKHYFVQSTASESPDVGDLVDGLHTAIGTALSPQHPITWQPTALTIYGRRFPIPRQYAGTAFFTFPELCGATLGPADYITLASTYHTLILTNVPILTFLQKNEARRLITLLDALYEARCRLFISAATGPDGIFFPETTVTLAASSSQGGELVDGDAVYPETYSEIYQDLNSPFRPNISSYSPSLSSDALEDDPPNRVRRPGSSFTDERKLGDSSTKAPDFANIGGLTGEDERFAVKRAKSRIWEMCSAKWWSRGQDEAQDHVSWWRPLPLELRHWEKPSIEAPQKSIIEPVMDASDVTTLDNHYTQVDKGRDIFAHGASPFRIVTNTPPKISWTHVWGTMKWGKRAGAWGKGVEGLEDREKKKKDEEQQG